MSHTTLLKGGPHIFGNAAQVDQHLCLPGEALPVGYLAKEHVDGCSISYYLLVGMLLQRPELPSLL